MNVSEFEFPILAKAVCSHLGVVTINQLAAVDVDTFVRAAYAVADDRQRVFPAVRDVNELLGDQGLSLAPSPPREPVEKKIANDGPPRDKYVYRGTFHCSGALTFGERRFIGREVDVARQKQGSIDLTVTPRVEQLLDLELAHIEVEPGTWDVYVRKGRLRDPLDVVVQHRSTGAWQLRNIGEIRAPDPVVAIVDADAAKHHARLVHESYGEVFDWGVTEWLTYPVDEDGDFLKEAFGYEWQTEAPRDGRVRRLRIQAYPGEGPSRSLLVTSEPM